MKNIKLALLFIPANMLVICWVVIAFLNREYPMVGHDYHLGIAQMLDTALHFHLNGLSVQWYTPTFGGGLPAFPNPNNSQFSIVELLTFWFEPWQAVIISTILMISAGFLASYRLFSRVLRLHWTSSILGAIFFSANGFIMQRIAVGHLGYQTLPLLALILLLLLDSTIPLFIAALGLALIAAALIHQAGYFIIVVVGLSLLLVFPALYLFRPQCLVWKRLLAIAAFGGLVAFLLSVSKLSAVYSFMRFFPRQVIDDYPADTISGLIGILLQLLGTMNLTPLFGLIHLDMNVLPGLMKLMSGASYDYWEFDMSLSPVIFGLLIAGLYKFSRHAGKHIQQLKLDKKWIAVLLLVFFAWLNIEFILAKGFFYPYLQHLPILGSLHVNARFAAALLFPLALAAAISYESFILKWSEKKITLVFLIVNTLTLLPLGAYFTIKYDFQSRIYDISDSITIYRAIQSGNIFEMTDVGYTAGNTQALSQHTSNLKPYEPIFGYSLENFQPEVKPGSIWNISDGYYNMTNPTGYVFPEANGMRPFERFRVGDQEKLELFVRHAQPVWKMPIYQQVFDWISALTLVFVLIFLGSYAIRQFWHSAKGRSG